jgi:hypothetical protein
MAKKQIECGNCTKKYFTNIIKVFVIKSRFCSDDQTPMFYDNIKKIYTCPKCSKVIEAKDTITVAGLGMKIVDVTVDYHKRDEYITKGFEIDTKSEPEKQVCKKCENLRGHIQHIIDEDIDFHKNIKDELRSLSNIEFMETFFKDVQPYLKRLVSEHPQLIDQVSNKKNLETLAKKMDEKVQQKESEVKKDV